MWITKASDKGQNNRRRQRVSSFKFLTNVLVFKIQHRLNRVLKEVQNQTPPCNIIIIFLPLVLRSQGSLKID